MLGITSRRAGMVGVLLALLTSRAAAQGDLPALVFTIEGDGPTIALADAFTGTAITAGDLLTPAAGLAPGPYPPLLAAPAPPGTMISGGSAPPAFGLGLFGHAGCVGLPPGSGCPVEVDALSFGRDRPLPAQVLRPGSLWFSVDEYAIGSGGSVPPDTGSEGALGHMEAAADLFIGKCPGGIAPLGAGAVPMGNVAAVDGDGLPNPVGTAYPGAGLVEPIPPGLPPDLGDDIDGADVGLVLDLGESPFPVYFSLEGSLADPLTGIAGSGTAALQGFFSGDLLVTVAAGATPVLFAGATTLGLDLLGGGTDDLDAVALFEEGSGLFEPSLVPHDWNSAGGRDMLLFSVRRGSAVIGAPDSRFGLPIEPGDVLSTPLPSALGGVSPFPSLFIAAEVLGLATTRTHGVSFGDELDSLDTLQFLPGADCNGNCVPDKVDIGNGLLTDDDPRDCVADECQDGGGKPRCFCISGAPCGNTSSTGGCANSTGEGGSLLLVGSNSVLADDLILVMTPLPPQQFGIFFMGRAPTSLVFGDGQRCVQGETFRYPVLGSTLVGRVEFGPVVGYANGHFGPSGQIHAGATWYFQGWYRDPQGPCGSGFNLTNAVSVTFVP